MTVPGATQVGAGPRSCPSASARAECADLAQTTQPRGVRPERPTDRTEGGYRRANQVAWDGSQSSPRATSVFISTSSFRMHAVIACLNVFPRATSRA